MEQTENLISGRSSQSVSTFFLERSIAFENGSEIGCGEV